MTQTKAELLQTRHQGDIRLGDADSTNYVGFKAPATVGSNLVWTLPATDGSANQFLKTNASGVLSWGSADTSTLMPLGGGTFTGNVTYNDGIKSRFGSDADLEVYHDGTNAYIKNATGDILFKHGSEDLIAMQDDGEVQLFYDGSQRLRTTSAGITITGALTVSTNATITGDLTVSGTTTTINTQTLDVEDKNIVIGKVSSPSDTTADAGGWTLKGATDKTFNWINATDAWTSSEHIHLIDNKKLFVGGASGTTDGLEIVHNGSNSILNDSGTGTLQLQLGGSTKLEIQSGGINVTGAINVNGAALSTAPSITATASGSIGANTAVHLQSDGTVKTASVTAPSLGSLGSIASGDSYPGNQGATVYNSSTNTIVVCYKNPSDGRPYAKAGTVSGTTITWGAEAEVSGGNDYDVESLSLSIDSDGTYVLIWDQSNHPYYTRSSIFTVDGTTIGTETVGNVFTGNTSNMQIIRTAASEFMVFYHYSSYTRRRKGTRNGTSITWTGDAQLYTQDFVRGCHLAGPNRIILPFANSGFKYRTFDVSAMSVSSEGTIFTSSTTWHANPGRFDLAAITNNQFIVCWNRLYDTSGNTVNELNIKTGYMADGATSVTWGATLNASVSGGIDNPTVHYNSSSGKCIVSYDRGNRTGRYAKEITLSSNNSGATCTVGSEIELYYSSNSSQANPGYELGNTVAAGEDGQDAFVFYVSNLGLKYKMRTAEGTSMTDENFIGFSDGTAYTNGQTATVNIVGNQTTQSSLTPAEKYYVQNDGSIGTSATIKNIYAGIALTSTKLAIKA